MKKISYSLLSAVVLLLFFYIFQVNALTREVYSVKDCETSIKTLSQEKASLELGLSKVSSLSNVGAYLETQNFVKNESVKYIRILDVSVASTK